MRVFVAVVFLATFVLLAEASWQHLKPLNVMPVYPEYAEQKPPQPVHVPVHEQDNRITGGIGASQGQFPWQAAVIIDYNYFCGGSLISDRRVITAAHCVYGFGNFEVRLGATRLDTTEPGSVTFRSSNYTVHPAYNGQSVTNDVAIIELPTGAPVSDFVRPVQLPPQFLWDITGDHVAVSGWGKTSDEATGISVSLNYVNTTVISNDICAATYGSAIDDTMICTSTTGGKSACTGDSGGPLVLLINDVYNLVGVVAFGHTAGCELNYPVAYSRVTSLLSWIASTS